MIVHGGASWSRRELRSASTTWWLRRKDHAPTARDRLLPDGVPSDGLGRVSGAPGLMALRPVVLNPSPIARVGGRVLIGSVAGCASEAILIETYDIAAEVCVIAESVPGQWVIALAHS